jgi:hypothetical protein
MHTQKEQKHHFNANILTASQQYREDRQRKKKTDKNGDIPTTYQ